ncbi:MAG TPA: GGDEF-domain containing protein [Sulfurospirillum sp. UBA11407]|nr:MAG TPA: GGDEF-domain containing protein [Sulfurospirillum sp. UBA11407]
MALLKKNIWFIFYVLLASITLFFINISHLKYKNVYNQYQTSQENLIELVANATHSLFDTHEKLLDIIGISILQDKHLEIEPQKIEEHVRPLLKDPTVGAFGVTKADGEFIYGSTDPNPKKLGNLLSIPQSRNSFLETLDNHSMTFGRTYFSIGADLWGMPLRKALRDEEGKPIAVMTTLLKSNTIFDNLIHSVKNKKNLVIFVLRDSDLYFQYHSETNHKNKKLYDTPLDKSFLDTLYMNAATYYNLSALELKRDQKIISFTYTDKKEYLTSVKFDKTYNLWIVVHTSLKDIFSNFLETFFIYFMLYAGCCFLFFLLFKMIAKAEEKRQKDLIHQATHDMLTSLPNRNYLQKQVNSLIDNNDKEVHFSLLYIDMDNFKNINDIFGHQFGDYVLVEISKRLKSAAPKDAIITRYGGDEFILITSITNISSLREFALSLIELLSKPYHIHELVFNVGASIGIALYPQHGKDLDFLLRSADIALYESKKLKNSVHVFADTMQEGFLKNIQIEQALRNAIEKNELFLVYQPQIDKDGALYGVEALARWNSSTFGFIPPDYFIPLAETAGLMPKIGKFILQEACTQIKDIQKECQQEFKLSINISVRQFMEDSFYEFLLGTITKTQIKNMALTLEITENLFVEDVQYLVPLLKQIRALGIDISIDDFGTGYSSLNMLRKLPIDELKIDKSFVDDIQDDDMAFKMVQNIITIGKNFGMRVLAEGVETKEQREMLEKLGCEYFQGYYFAKPLPPEELNLFIKSYNKTKESK